jgi:hypothetical protein
VPVTRHSGKRPFPECQGQGTRGRGHLPRVLGLGTRGRAFPIFFKRLRLFAPSNATFLFRVLFFPECNSSPSATLGEDCLPQVPDFWHSGKHVALGEYCFSRSVPPNAFTDHRDQSLTRTAYLHAHQYQHHRPACYHTMPRVDEGVQFAFMIMHDLVPMSPNPKPMYRIVIEKHTTCSPGLWKRTRYSHAMQVWIKLKRRKLNRTPPLTVLSFNRTFRRCVSLLLIYLLITWGISPNLQLLTFGTLIDTYP